tara:strand:+ start:1017 stop:1799 length:783 start_codon:yes stop_codon:yes gene_type:complete
MTLNASILTDNSLTVVLDGKVHTMSSDSPNFTLAKEALTEERYEDLEELFDLGQAIESYVEGNVRVDNNTVYYKDVEVHNHVVDRVLHFMQNDLPFKPLLRFLDKLMDNPSRRSVEELYRFLEHKNMPLTPDGNFLAYKGVKSDFTDCYSGKFDNSVGQILEMPRNTVCDDANMGCSYGFHAGSYEYAKGYASGGGNLMIVEIDPSDVVSVPHDCDCQKLRTAKYKVVALHETIERPLEEALVDDYYDEEDEYYDYDETY